MTSDQWPRYEVFKQDKPGQPHRNVGSVHAPDAELALQNARDVFARRPACFSLWVIPAAAIFMRTAEEFAAERHADRPSKGDRTRYAVFGKRSQRQAMTYVDYVGEVEAGTPEEAMRLAVKHYNEPPGIVWWVCPAGEIGRSEAEDIPGFEAATGKKFRMPNQYHTVFTMQKIKRGEGDEA
jgi:ring-1,2-phenylacetyl-CoA epoxidase subunit PaaB